MYERSRQHGLWVGPSLQGEPADGRLPRACCAQRLLCARRATAAGRARRARNGCYGLAWAGRERLTRSSDPAIRRLYSFWSRTQEEWDRTGYDSEFVSDPKSARS